MSILQDNKNKSRGGQKLNSRNPVVETLERETTGMLAAPSVLDNALGGKKVSSIEENFPDFSQSKMPLLEDRKQLDIINEKPCQKRISLVSVFEQRGYFRQARILNECQTKWVYYECQKCGSIGRGKNHCGMRVCPDCASRMKVKLLVKYRKGLIRLSDFYKKRLRLVTLTLKNVSELRSSDFNAISEIKEAFYRLRKRPILRKKIYGGVYGVETTHKGRGWHVHIHALISSEFIRDACKRMKEAKDREEEKKIERNFCSCCKQKCLRRLWQEETGSTVVDIRKADVDAIAEIVGYITKPFSTDNPGLLVDWWEIMRNRPFLKPFGCFYDMRKLKALLTCPWCGGRKFKVYYGTWVRLCDLRSDVERSPPLGVDIENFPKVLFINPGKVVMTTDKKGFEDRVLYLESNFELLVGTYE